MSTRVFAWDANPLVDPRLYRISNLSAKELIASGRAEKLELPDKRPAIQLRPTEIERREKSIGAGNLVPFGRSYNPLLQPPRMHYEIPRAGDCRSVCLRRYSLRSVTSSVWIDGDMRIKTEIVRRRIHVSSRRFEFSVLNYIDRIKSQDPFQFANPLWQGR